MMIVRFNKRTTVTIEKGCTAEIDASLFPLLKGRCEEVVQTEKQEEQPAEKKTTRKKKAAE